MCSKNRYVVPDLRKDKPLKQIEERTEKKA
jgi:hypothetical protein